MRTALLSLGLAVVWIIGIATSNMMGGLIHLFLIAAVVAVIVSISKGISNFHRIDYGS